MPLNTLTWEPDCIALLRVLTNDTESPQRYTDDRLKKVLVVAGFQLLRQVNFSQNFVIDITEQSITPDPTNRDNNTNDENFVNLMCMKAACIIDTGAAIIAAQNAFSAKDMVTQVDLRGVATSTIAILEKGYCSTFELALANYMDGDAAICAAVMGPFRLQARNFSITSLVPPYRIF